MPNQIGFKINIYKNKPNSYIKFEQGLGVMFVWDSLMVGNVGDVG